jgi:ubiquinone/menaquinone biosynthesis C-methylase UbiE
MDLYEFYTHTAYNVQPEVDALKEHITGSVLFVGNYAGSALAPHFEESFAAIPDQNVLFACQTDNEADIKYAGADLTHLPYPDDAFDTVISAYNMTHTEHARLSELKRVAKEVLLLIEADPSSQYVDILNALHPMPIPDLSQFLVELREYNVIEESIESTYTFSTPEDFTKYFQAEFSYHKESDVSQEAITAAYEQTVSERVVLFVCR